VDKVCDGDGSDSIDVADGDGWDEVYLVSDGNSESVLTDGAPGPDEIFNVQNCPF
jgi:hypothetical protein